MDWEILWGTLSEWLMGSGLKVLISVIIMIISFKLIHVLIKKLGKANEKNAKIDKTLSKTLLYVAEIALKCLVVLCIIGYLGIDTSAITAMIASLGVCAGLAVNGALGNIAGGVLLIVTRPFRVDDYIQVEDFEGFVEDIHLCHTKIVTFDNRVIYVPNGKASDASVINFTEKELRRVDIDFEISEEESFDEAKQILWDVVNNHEKVLKDKENIIRVCGTTDDGIVICCRAWVKKEDYWDVYFDIREQAKRGFDAAQIEFPYAQMDVRVIDKRDREMR